MLSGSVKVGGIWVLGVGGGFLKFGQTIEKLEQVRTSLSKGSFIPINYDPKNRTNNFICENIPRLSDKVAVDPPHTKPQPPSHTRLSHM